MGFGLSCGTAQSKQLTMQELEVYRILLTDKPKEIVVIDETIVGVFGEIESGGLKEILKGLQNDTFEDFVKANSTLPIIDDNLKTAFKYHITTKIDFEKEKKPSRYYLFSRVGFSNNGKQAVVIFNQACLALCGKGSYILLNKTNGVWEIAEESITWKS